MKKVFSILVAVMMCLCLIVPSALAADGLDLDSLTGALEGVDISSLSDSELTSILDGLDLEGVDLDSLKNQLGSLVGEGDAKDDKLSELSDAISGLANGSVPAAGSTATGGDSSLSNLSGLLGGVDMSWLPNVVSDPSSIASMFTDASAGGGFDLSALEDMIGGVFSGSGLDLASLTSGIDLGSFDITSLLGGLGGGIGGGDAASGVSDMVASLTDGLKSGLQSLGIDTSFLDGMMDNDIVNFFANLFIGLGDVVKSGDISSLGSMLGGGDSSSSDTADYSGSYSTDAVTPNTGDTSAVLVAIGTISVAAAAAFVCLMKKE